MLVFMFVVFLVRPCFNLHPIFFGEDEPNLTVAYFSDGLVQPLASLTVWPWKFAENPQGKDRCSSSPIIFFREQKNWGIPTRAWKPSARNGLLNLDLLVMIPPSRDQKKNVRVCAWRYTRDSCGVFRLVTPQKGVINLGVWKTQLTGFLGEFDEIYSEHT